MSYTKIFYHIVLRTKRSEKSISQNNVSSLYKYIWGIIKNENGKLYRINGMEDHIHILSELLLTRSTKKTGLSHTSKDNKNTIEMKVWRMNGNDY